MKRTLSVLLALFLISAIAGAWLGAGHCQEKPQATNRQQAALTLVDESAQAVASAVARWRTRFVERLRRADGTPLAAQDVLEAALDTDRVVGELRREFSELKGALPNPDTDSDALLDRLDALAESAIVARWQLAQAETHLAIQLIQGEYDDAIAAAQKRFGPSQREAYAEAEWQARRAAMAAYTAETDSLAESRRRARLAFDRWAAGLVRQPTTRRMAEAIETHLNVSPGCEAAVKTSLDRFLCEHEIIFGGATAVIEAPRARMADAFDAYEVELESVPEAGVAGYPFLKPDVARFVASYESLEAPIWPPERHPWARTLPPQIATALERGSRILLFHGLGIVSADGSEPAIESEDPKILYQLLATARGSVPEEGRDPVTWDGYMREGWSRPAWLTLQRSLLPLDASERWRETIAGADLVMVLAKVLPGALPGQKNLRLAGLPAYWILPAGTANADVDFVRERVPDDFEPVRHGFIGERLRVAVRLDVPVPLDAIPVAIAADPKAYPETQAGAAAVSRTLIATKDSADPRLYVSQPFGLEWLPDYIRVKSPGVIPAYSDDGLVAGVDTNAVRLRSPGRMTVVRDPDSIVNSWRRAVDRVAGLHGVTVGPDLRAFLRRQAESFTTHLRYRLPKTATDIADAEFVTVDVALGHHAALLLLRDELIRALKEVQADMAELETAYQAGDVRARTHLRQLEIELADSNSPWQVVPVKGPADFNSLPRPGNFEVSRLGEFWSAARGEVPLARIIDEAYLARHFEPFEAQRWRVSAAYEGIAYFKNALQTSIQHAQRIKDADIEGMLHLVRFGFAPIVARVLPDIVMRTPSNSPSPWRSDADSRQYVRGVLDVADRFGTGREIGATQRSIAFAALALGTVVAAPEVLAFRVLQVASAGLGAIDLAAFTIPEYLKRRAEVAFAIGASPVLGTGRLQWAEARAIPEWSVVLDGVLLMIGGAGDFRALMGHLRLTREAAQLTSILDRLKTSSSAFSILDVADEARYFAMLGDALAAERAKRNLSPIQRAYIDFYRSQAGFRAEMIDRVRRSLDWPPGWHAARAGGRRISASPITPPAHYPPALAGARPMSVRAIDADGRITVYEIGDLIGSGTGSYVYACRNVPGVVLKFPNEGISAADWLDEATRIDGLLNETGIRHLPILSVAPDAPIPFYVQARLPADARRFASAEGIVGYEITRPGTVVPVTATPDDLRALEAKGLVRLQFGYSLADGGVLPRPMQRALMRLYKRVGLADLAAEDLHLDNVYFVRQGLGWEAGILDLEYIGPWRQLPDVDPELAIKVLNIEQLSGKRMPVLLPSMAGKDYSAELRMLAEAGEERFYPDADFFMEKMLEYKWYIRYLPAEKRWIGSMVDLDIVQEYFPNFRQHVTPNLVDLADQRALGVPGPRVDVGLEPVPARPWPESVGPRGPPDPAATLDKAQPPVPSPKPVYDPYAPTAGRLGASPQASAAGPRPVPAVGISEDAIQRREPPDMVYGLYRKQPEGLPEWTRRRGGQTLEDIQEFRLEAAAMDLSHSLIGNRRRSVAGLVVAAEEGRQVHFDLNGMDPTAPWTPGHPNFDSVTSAELRHLRENWADFNPRPKFYLDGAEVRAPWLDLPTTPRPTPGGKPPPPRPPGSGGSVPQQSRPSGLTDPAPPEPPSERLADPQEFTLSTPRTPSTPAERQKLLEQELAARWGNQLRRDAAEEAKRQEEAIRLRPAQEAAFRFDVSALPVHRGTQPRNLNDSLAPVRQLVPGDTRYVGSIMSGAEHKPAQTYLYAHLVNHYVAQILAGGQFPSGGNGLRILIDANGVIQEGHHRYVAAQIVRRLTGRPLFTGPERIIPDTQVAFGAVVKAPKPETSWDKLSIRPPREEKR